MQEQMEQVEEPTEVEAVEAVEESNEPTPQQEDRTTSTGRETKGNVFARNRILERENKVILRRMEDLMARLESKAQPEPEPVEEVPFEVDPLKSIHTRQERIERELKREREEAKKRDEERELRTKFTVANEAIQDFMDETPDYGSAIEHLGQIEYEEALEENPDLSHEEVDRLLYDRLNEQKLRWIKAGKNPGEELYKKAQRRGYRKQEAAQRPEHKDAKAEVEAERKRAAAGSSISRAAGRASEGRVNASKIARMTDAEYREWADEQLKKSGGGRMRMKDLLAGKIKEN